MALAVDENSLAQPVHPPVVWEQPDQPESAISRQQVATSLGLDPATATRDPAMVPLRLHERLLGLDDAAAVRQAAAERFVAGGCEFWWLGPAPGRSGLDALVGLAGHTIAWPPDEVRAGVAAALEVIASRPWAMALVRTYVSTFACGRPASPADEAVQITSCSLPDFPLCVFLSARALVHIPPMEIASRPDVRLAAENIYHEAVHQMVNHRLLTGAVLDPAYRSETSPRVPIAWRSTAAEERNREWELDRVLHAAAVYCHLLRWRYHELSDRNLPESYQDLVRRAASDAINAVGSLTDALLGHEAHFTPAGVTLVRTLAGTAGRWAAQLATAIGAPEAPRHGQGP